MFKKLFSLFFGFFGKQEPKAESELYDKYNTPVLKEKLTLPAAIDELAKSELSYWKKKSHLFDILTQHRLEWAIWAHPPGTDPLSVGLGNPGQEAATWAYILFKDSVEELEACFFMPYLDQLGANWVGYITTSLNDGGCRAHLLISVSEDREEVSASLDAFTRTFDGFVMQKKKIRDEMKLREQLKIPEGV